MVPQEGRQRFRAGVGVGQGLFRFAQAILDAGDAHAAFQVLQNRPVFEFHEVLGQIAHAQIFRAFDRAAVRFRLSRQDAKQRGLPRPVVPDKPDAGTIRDHPIDAAENNLLSEGQLKSLYVDQRSIPPEIARRR